MSTEHQQYSPQNQADAIALYAGRHDLDIIQTYADLGRSGLSLTGRAALQTLLTDVESRRNDFTVLLVYDVSRWGRFQDADESAYYEYILRRAGVHVHYCAEPFANDGSLASVLLKSLKRTMAGEYSRELSSKVFAGQSRLIELGFRQGGHPGYGLKRQLIDKDGNPKMCLSEKERKSIHTDRIILVPGPAAEVAVVSSIYRNFINLRKGETAIAADLNAQGIKTQFGKAWTHYNVHGILVNPKYTGLNVYNRSSGKLKQKRVRNPPEMWIQCEDAFERVVSTEEFQTVQSIVNSRKRQWTDDEMLDGLRDLIKTHGRLSTDIIDDAGSTLRSQAYARRFGGLTRAYALVGWRSERGSSYFEANRITGDLVESIVKDIEKAGATVDPCGRKGLFLINHEFTASIRVAPCYQRSNGHQWKIRIDPSRYSDVSLVARIDPDNKSILDYYFFPSSELHGKRLCLRRSNPPALDVYRFENLSFFVDLCRRRPLESAS